MKRASPPEAAPPHPLRRLARPLARWLLPPALFLVLPLLLFWPVLWGGATMVPFDNLFQGLPWAPFAAELDVRSPHNELVSDLILQNYQWKQFAVEQYARGELPLWQERQFAGSPFLAAGQHSMLYPLSLLFLLLPLPVAFGWFTVFSLALAGLTMFALARTLGLRRPAALLAGLSYQGSGFLTISVLFPMVVAGAAWLPLLLAALYRLRRTPGGSPLPWVGVGALAVGMAALAGHVEILYYTLLVGALFALWLLGVPAQVESRRAAIQTATRFAAYSLASVLLGLMLGAAQLVPLYELVSQNFREGRSDLPTVLGYAWPLRQAASFVVPDLLGNPARHHFYNLETRRWEPIVTQQPLDAAGNTAALDHVAWFKGSPTWKNYVEGAGYLGILPLILALLAVGRWLAAAWLRRRRRAPAAIPQAAVPFFALLAGVSGLFIFGSPLYALLFYGLPGWNQLHTPFRWIFPLTLAVSLLAASGWQAVADQAPASRQRAVRHRPWLAGLLLAAGVGGLGLLLAMWAAPAPWLALAAKALDRSQLAQWAFGGSAALFLSYQWANFVPVGLALVGAGVLLLLARRGLPRRPLAALALALVGVDLLAAAWGFMPRVPMRVADFVPPSLQWLAAQHEPGGGRVTALERDWKVLNANSGMQFGLEDVRGYDSIIARHFVHFMQATAPQPQLDFNRIAPLRPDATPPPDPELLDLLGVRFLMTDQPLDWPGWSLAFDGEVRIYENGGAMPRAFLLGNGRYWGPRSQAIPLERLQALDPRTELLLQGEARPPQRSALPFTPVAVARYTPNQIELQVDAPLPGWLVLTEVDFPGWRAFSRAAGSEAEVEHEVLRADGAFRAIWLEAGPQTVRWSYAPNSVKVGFFASFLGAAGLLFLAALWGWERLYVPQAEEATARRVARNSAAPMALQLFNKAIDTVFAAFMARFLGPESLGQYAFAVAFIWYFIIFSNFGLGTLLTRDAARDRAAAARLLNSTLLLRGALYALALPLLLGLLWLWPRLGGTLEPDTAWAIGLLALGLIPSNLADALTALFRAYEKFEVPALVATIATFVKVIGGAGALLLGWGIVGLAATSILTNVVTLAILSVLMVRTLLRPTLRWEATAWRALLRDALPLMLNELLATAFFRIDQVMLKPMRGNSEAGFYNVSYKFIDGLLILPSSLTLALFPVMSRHAQGAPDALLRTTRFTLRWLLIVALPIALLTTRYAEGIVLAFGGPEFLPASAQALQLLIWFLPFSFVNSLLQYVLIAADQQHLLTRAYVWALAFNLLANFFAIWRFGLYGAAAVTILSEVALLLPFNRLMRARVGRLPWAALFGRPVAALAVAALPLWAGRLPFWLAIPASLALYVAALALLRAFSADDRTLLQRLRRTE